VISAVAPLLSSLAHFVGEKLGEQKIRQSVPDYIVKDASDAHARVGQIDKVWQVILSTGGGGRKILLYRVGGGLNRGRVTADAERSCDR
jgi:hypothetical protein